MKLTFIFFALAAAVVFNFAPPARAEDGLPANPTNLGTCSAETLRLLDPPEFAKSPIAGSPLVIFVHGGAWRRGDKTQGEGLVSVFNSHGYSFASINYRLDAQVHVLGQALDICAAVQSLARNSANLGFDPKRVFLMGHSAGASLAALVAPILHVRGLILLDPVALDVSGEIKQVPALTRIFGADHNAWASMSPKDQAQDGTRFPPAYIAYTDYRPDTKLQAQSFASALIANNSPVQAKFYPGLRHGSFFLNVAKPTEMSSDVFAFLDKTSN